MKTKNIIATLALSFLILLTSCAASDAGVSPTPAATQNNITTAEPAAVEPTSTPIPSASAAPEASTLTVHYIDVGQADSSLIICGGESMLIDGGNVADSDLVAAYLKKKIFRPSIILFALTRTRITAAVWPALSLRSRSEKRACAADRSRYAGVSKF